MSEKAFLDQIDCNFPYHDRKQCLDLIDQSLSISANAVFAVVAELCRVPKSQKKTVSARFLLELIDIIDSKFEHPVKEMALTAARKMVINEELSVDEAIAGIVHVSRYPGVFHAWSIFYFSCNDSDGILDNYPYN